MLAIAGSGVIAAQQNGNPSEVEHDPLRPSFSSTPRGSTFGPQVGHLTCAAYFPLIRLSYHVLANPAMPRVLPSGGVLVPQRVYTPERPAIAFQPSVPIRFQQNGVPGIRLTKALANNTFGMPDADVPVQLSSNSLKVGVRNAHRCRSSRFFYCAHDDLSMLSHSGPDTALGSTISLLMD